MLLYIDRTVQTTNLSKSAVEPGADSVLGLRWAGLKQTTKTNKTKTTKQF